MYKRLTKRIDNYIVLNCDSPYSDKLILDKLADLEDIFEDISENCIVITADDRKELLKFVSGEFVESSIVQRLLGISFEECMTRFIFARTASWNKAPLNGQNITNYFRIPIMEKE